ncbi:hypothetical protein PYW08_011363 [Mythimna loreyi]|uniref:Uncharacterized protein n=1 Tax=Mythimna loreyi TaxID=667449 RepID=A0ACC2Q5I8_9NEOP|nr:hypothetical protein PYW08_011363 [Mythimna loreyi]
MQFTYLLAILSITLTPSLNQKLTPNAVTSLLQGLLSSKNTGPVMQMLSSAANKKRPLSNVPKTISRRYVIAENMPKTVLESEALDRMTHVVERPSEKCIKKNIMVQNPVQVIQNGNQMVLPKNMVVQRRLETVLPKNVIIQNGGEVSLPRNVIVRKNEMPRRLVQNHDFTIKVPEIVQQKVLRTQPTDYVTVPQQKVLIRSENPFLPAASPVSPLTALSSSGLPPAGSRSRGQFLRKIPIPPPTI